MRKYALQNAMRKVLHFRKVKSIMASKLDSHYICIYTGGYSMDFFLDLLEKLWKVVRVILILVGVFFIWAICTMIKRMS